MNYTHLLLTRFNLRYSQAGSSGYICNDKWHQERFELFNRFCLPSVAGQTSQQFKWLIFFNDEKRGLYSDFIKETEQKLPNVEFIFVKPDVYHKNLLDEYVSRQIDAEYLITTRLDNDDCIARHYMESVQKKFFKIRERVDKSDMIIDAHRGYQFETTFPYRKSEVDGYDFSPFLSLVAKVQSSGRTATVLDHQHHLWGEHSSSEKLSDEQFWVQIIHKKNVANRILDLHLKLQLSDENFPFFDRVPKNNTLAGMILLPLQYLITLIQRTGRKIAGMRQK